MAWGGLIVIKKFFKFTARVTCLGVVSLFVWSSLATAQDGNEGPPLEKQVEAVHAYVARTREWSRQDYTVKVLRDETQHPVYVLPTFRVSLTSTSLRSVEFDKQFDVFLDSRSGEVVGENARHPEAVRDEH